MSTPHILNSGRLLYESQTGIMQRWGIEPIPWQELTDEQRATWEENAHDIAAQDREDINA